MPRPSLAVRYDPTDRTPLSPLQLVAERLAGLTIGAAAQREVRFDQ